MHTRNTTHILLKYFHIQPNLGNLYLNRHWEYVVSEHKIEIQDQIRVKESEERAVFVNLFNPHIILGFTILNQYITHLLIITNSFNNLVNQI